MAWTAPRTYVTGEVVTASILNTDLRDNMLIVGARTLGYAQVTANQGSITAEVDLTGLSVTASVGSGRRIRVSFSTYPSITNASELVKTRLKEGATQLTEVQDSIELAGQGFVLDRDVVLTPSAASHTYKLTMARITGSGTITSNAAATYPAFILVEDIT